MCAGPADDPGPISPRLDHRHRTAAPAQRAAASTERTDRRNGGCCNGELEVCGDGSERRCADAAPTGLPSSCARRSPIAGLKHAGSGQLSGAQEFRLAPSWFSDLSGSVFELRYLCEAACDLREEEIGGVKGHGTSKHRGECGCYSVRAFIAWGLFFFPPMGMIIGLALTPAGRKTCRHRKPPTELCTAAIAALQAKEGPAPCYRRTAQIDHVSV